ncbi:hypothetical protein [Ruania alba]|uniref:Uncharacterized protein n=1 Tax=Ruania alba TaxID=648782 RepID=A0A1H5LNV3_9MICO|nr:hypothetical protein [Ruania alba]SEE78217.1 hypothetical protein SAMN04488554_2884 [Ruania alba]
MTNAQEPTARWSAPRRLQLPMWLYPLVGVTAVLVGLLPWFRRGLRLPVQNLWAGELPGTMPFALLPLNQYYLTAILGLMVTAGLLAGLVVHAAPAKERSRATALTALGVSIGYLGAGLQSGWVLAHGLQESTLARAYLAFVIGWTVVSAFGGLIVLGLLGRGRRGGVPLAVALAAPALGAWAAMLISPSPATATPFAWDAVEILRWLPAVAVGVALGWCGARTVGRLGAWMLSLVLLYVLPGVLTAISSAAGYRVAGDPSELIAAGLDALSAALAPDVAGPPVLVAVSIAIVGAIIEAVLAWRRSKQPRAPRPAAGEQ